MGCNDIIKEFFTNMRCSQCSKFFEESSIKILRNEENYTVVKVECSNCSKNLGIALLGLDKEAMKTSIDQVENDNALPFEIDNSNNKIDYDDVIDAHNFFYSLGDDWSKYLPEIN